MSDERETRSPMDVPDERDLAGILLDAGPRHRPREEDLDAIRQHVLDDWHRRRRHPGSATGPSDPFGGHATGSAPSPPRADGGRRSPPRLPALAAGIALVGVGLAVWWVLLAGPRDTDPTAVAAIADVVRVDGDVAVGTAGGDELALGIGDGVPAGVTLRTGADSRVALELSGGRSLRLDSETLVLLAGRERLELVRGRLYVDSPRSTAPAITVVTDQGSATEVGTQFEVAVVGSDRALRVRVREGAVLVAVRHDGGAGGPAVSATAGEEVVAREGGLLRSAQPVWGDAWAWVLQTAPPRALDGLTVEQALQWIARESGREVVYASDEVARTARRARISTSLGPVHPEQALQFLPAAGLVAGFDGGRIEVRDAFRPGPPVER